jgi:hypothetical protein
MAAFHSDLIIHALLSAAAEEEEEEEDSGRKGERRHISTEQRCS